MNHRVAVAVVLTSCWMVSGCPAPRPSAPVDAAVLPPDAFLPLDAPSDDGTRADDDSPADSPEVGIDAHDAADIGSSDGSFDVFGDMVAVPDAPRDASVPWELPDGSPPADPAIQIVHDLLGGCILRHPLKLHRRFHG